MPSEPLTWESRHLYHGGAANPLLVGFVLPMLRSLRTWEAGRSFFFVRYGDVAGPHLRLRFGLVGGPRLAPARRRIQRALAHAERRYLAAQAGAPQGAPELRCVTEVFEPEVERYGGPSNLALSLDFFSISSAVALDYLRRYGDRARNRQIALALCVLLWQAWGFARDAAELALLVQYEAGSGVAPVARARADEIFDGDPRRWSALVGEQLADLASAEPEVSLATVTLGSAGSLAAATRLLAGGLAEVEPGAKVNIGSSHLHMTANRLGLSNWEECFVARMLYRGLSHLGPAAPAAARLDIDAALDLAWSASRERTYTLRDLIPRYYLALEDCDENFEESTGDAGDRDVHGG